MKHVKVLCKRPAAAGTSVVSQGQKHAGVLPPVQLVADPQDLLRKPVGVPREEPIIPGYRQPTQVHQRPLHTGHVLSWKEGGKVSVGSQQVWDPRCEGSTSTA